MFVVEFLPAGRRARGPTLTNPAKDPVETRGAGADTAVET